MKKKGKAVECHLSDCFFYECNDDTKTVYCTNPNRDFVESGRPCPYYKLDWAKRMELLRKVKEKQSR